MWIIALWAAAAVGAAAADLAVVYTGRSIGYARACQEEVLRPLPEGRAQAQYKLRRRHARRSVGVTLYRLDCVKWQGTENYPARLLAQLDAARKGAGQTLTLGAGDHFALDFRARTIVVEGGPGKRRIADRDDIHYLKDLNGWVLLDDFEKENRRDDFETVIRDDVDGTSELGHDSVARFLVDAGFDAIVPGKHDFYFGPEHVRRVARYLEAHHSRMLGANLVIRGQRLDPVPTRAAANRSRNFRSGHASVRIQSPKFVLPWWRRVKVAGADGAGVKALDLCKSTDPDQQSCGPDSLRMEPTEGGFFEIKQKEVQPLQAGATYHLCAPEDKEKDDNGRYCETLIVERPFLDSALPYLPLPAKDAVVFGAVAAGMEKRTGRLNVVWRHQHEPGHPEYEIRMEALDPQAALAQALDYCRANGDCPEGRTRVLLAHMTAEAARGIQRTIGAPNRFSLVITEATAVDYTPFAKVDYPADYPPLVVTPAMPYGAGTAGTLQVHAQHVVMHRCCAGGQTSRGFAGGEFEPAGHEVAEIGTALTAAVEALGFAKGDGEQAFRTLVLEAMRREGKASVAILQKRDLFEIARRLRWSPDGASNREERLRAAVEGILWKGDFLLTRMVKGSQLEQALARGKEFDRQDADIYHERDEHQLGLHVLGAFEDPSSRRWVTDAAPIEAAKPYKVALTDYLAFGDTGYPELSQPLAGKEQRPAELERSPRIADIVYQALAEPGTLGTEGRQAAWSFFDYLHWPPPSQAKPVEPPRAHWSALMADYFRAGRSRSPALPGRREPETLVQVRPRWRILDEKTEFSVSWLRNNQPDQSVLLRRFQGVPDSRVTAAESSIWGSAWAVEVRREKRRSTDFVRVESRFQEQELQNRDGRVAQTYPQNEMSVEGGWRGSFTPVIHQKRWTGVTLSGVWNTQFANPRIDASYSFPKPDAGCPDGSKPGAEGSCAAGFDARLARTSRYLAKAGLRRESRDSNVEAGLFGGSVRRALEYRFAEMEACNLSTVLISQCLGSLRAESYHGLHPRQTTIRGSGLETGAFLNLHWRIPLRPDGGVQVVIENRGRLYFNNEKDFNLDTRVNNLFSAGLAVPIAGRLALKPTWSLFHFRNKASVRDPVARPSFGLTSNAVEMKLEYRFDWLQGQSWAKVLRYGGGR